MRYIIITKKSMFVLFAVTVLTLSVFVTLNDRRTATASATATENLPIYCVNTDARKLAITFDAAWGAEDTDRLLQILNKYNAKATFFVVGTWAENNSSELYKLFSAGHEIGNHSYAHKLYGKLSTEEIVADTEKCNKLIADITGVAPVLFRFPSGDYNENAVKTVRQQQLEPIQWNVDSLDWQGLSKDEIVKRVVSGADDGSIILFHNDVKNTPEALEEILNVLSKKEYSFVTVSQLIYSKPYRIDATGKQYSAGS